MITHIHSSHRLLCNCFPLQLRAARYEVHDIFFSLSAGERMQLINWDRELARERELRRQVTLSEAVCELNKSYTLEECWFLTIDSEALTNNAKKRHRQNYMWRKYCSSQFRAGCYIETLASQPGVKQCDCAPLGQNLTLHNMKYNIILIRNISQPFPEVDCFGVAGR